ncbi:hypothetical protein LK994_01900 [Ferruginibacter lapsinanis]|uniref:hypothetical protein n=1 Tax=Ferruginibacter lapsinanis TaxID=563172 RepID=UPI001E59B13F|nr:hypothetical protein [Ferruginibacter lapsinanis]UEG50227.1 hypothetical protein LK994_01900 [Ferruginibacter lapsinanis]
MTVPKYLILLLTVLFSSCGNNSTHTSEANTLDTSKSVDTGKQIANSKPVDTALLKIWSAFQQAVSTNNISQFRQLSLDSLYSCDTTLSTTKFIKNCYKEIFDTLLLRKITIPTEINQLDKEMELGYFTKSVPNKADFTGDAITLKQFQVVKEFTPDGAWTMTFDFIKTKEGYRFFGCDSYGGPICCR